MLKTLFVSTYNVRHFFNFSKNRYFDFGFLTSQRFTRPHIRAHMMFSIGKIDMLLSPKVIFNPGQSYQ